MAKTNKTKEELLQEIEVLQTKVNKLERFEKYVDVADEIAAMREAFENSGFSRDESMQMLLTFMKMSTKFIKPSLF